MCQMLSEGLPNIQEDAVTVPAQAAQPEVMSSETPSNNRQKVSLPDDPFYKRVTKVFAIGVKCALFGLACQTHTTLRVKVMVKAEFAGFCLWSAAAAHIHWHELTAHAD